VNSRDSNRMQEAISNLLVNRMKLEFRDLSLNDDTCNRIYRTIFDTVVEVFVASNMKLSNEFVNYVAQQYYDAVAINGNNRLNPNIFTQRAKLDDINLTELRFMAIFFKDTDHIVPVIHELKRRG